MRLLSSRTKQRAVDDEALAAPSARPAAPLTAALSALVGELEQRNALLLSEQLSCIEQVTRRAQDPELRAVLADLAGVAGRVRRNTDAVLLFTGNGPVPDVDRPMPLAEVVRAAAAAVAGRARVDAAAPLDLEVEGRFAADFVRLLVELMDNALRFSPAAARVTVTLSCNSGGLYAEVRDGGPGMDEERRTALNAVLAADAPGPGPGSLGVHLVAYFARRVGARVELAPAEPHGVSARVTLPLSVLAGELPVALQPPARPAAAPGRVRGLRRSAAAEVLAPPSGKPPVQPTGYSDGEVAQERPRPEPGSVPAPSGAPSRPAVPAGLSLSAPSVLPGVPLPLPRSTPVRLIPPASRSTLPPPREAAAAEDPDAPANARALLASYQGADNGSR